MNTVELIDAHCHFIDYDDDILEEIILQSKQNGVIGAIENATFGENFEKVTNIYEKYKDFIYPSYGTHPLYLNKLGENWEDKYTNESKR